VLAIYQTTVSGFHTHGASITTRFGRRLEGATDHPCSSDDDRAWCVGGSLDATLRGRDAGSRTHLLRFVRVRVVDQSIDIDTSAICVGVGFRARDSSSLCVLASPTRRTERRGGGVERAD
jgi:hypothetical protein